ncbi:MAG: CfrBI family restriction endonuclease, partial [Fimbriimonadales bacterium]
MDEQLLSEVVFRLLTKQGSHRDIVTEAIDTLFLQYAIDFFQRIVEAKINDKEISLDWYRQFIESHTSKEEICTLAGLNLKTIQNRIHSTRKAKVLEASLEHYEQLKRLMKKLVEDNSDIDIQLTIKFRNVSVELNLNETLIVVNALAVKRVQLRGGQWSALGKRVEKLLMLTLCNLFSVSAQHYRLVGQSAREVDFYFSSSSGKEFKCEVKLMGRGNPESADAAFARGTDLLVADRLSSKVKQALNEAGKLWIAFDDDDWGQRFYQALTQMGIP